MVLGTQGLQKCDRLLVFKGIVQHSGKVVHINNTICAVLHRLSSFTVLVNIFNKCEIGVSYIIHFIESETKAQRC